MITYHTLHRLQRWKMSTLDSGIDKGQGIDVGQLINVWPWINIGPKKFAKKNKCRALTDKKLLLKKGS